MAWACFIASGLTSALTILRMNDTAISHLVAVEGVFIGSIIFLHVTLRMSDKPSRGKLPLPLNATFLLYLFYDAKNCDALVGDLEERYKLIRKKFGARRANFWYWVQVITSVGPIVWAASKKLVKAISGVAALVEMWRRIRS
jgi:hypothetical protein